MENKYSIVLFDFFGVISTPCYYPIIKKHIASDKQEEYISKLDELDKGNLAEADLVKMLAEQAGVDVNVIETEADANIQLNFELLEYIETDLRTRVEVGLLTNIPSGLLNRIMGQRLELFSKRYVSSELKLIKPDPAIFEYVIKDLNVEPKTIIFVDDSQRNVDVALSLGITAMQLTDNIETIRSLKKLCQ